MRHEGAERCMSRARLTGSSFKHDPVRSVRNNYGPETWELEWEVESSCKPGQRQEKQSNKLQGRRVDACLRS